MRLALQSPNFADIGNRLLDFERLIGSPEPLLKKWGVIVEREIQQNFAQGGRPKWEPITPWTRAGRRGTGDSARPLVDTGQLRSSFDHSISGRKLIVFSTDPKAVWHEFGVAPRAEIRPKNAKALALPFLKAGNLSGGRAGPSIPGQFSLTGLQRSRSVRPGSRTVKFRPAGIFGTSLGAKIPKRLQGRVGKNVVPYKNIMFVTVIKNWPGIPARPMLPVPEEIAPRLSQIARQELLRTLLARAARRTEP